MFENRFRGFSTRVTLLIIFGAGAISSLYFFHELYIQFILIVWNIVVLLFILSWEKEKSKRQANFPNASKDARWVNASKELEHIRGRLDKTKDPMKRKALQSRQRFLRDEIRRLEWSIRETNMNEILGAQKNTLKEIEPKYPAIRKSSELGASNPDEFDETREKARKKDDEYLERVVNELVSVLNAEPANSLQISLRPFAGELRAHYNIIRQKDPDSVSASNYWVVWALVYGLAEQSQINPQISKYASKNFRSIVYKLIHAIEARKSSDSNILRAKTEDGSDPDLSKSTMHKEN